MAAHQIEINIRLTTTVTLWPDSRGTSQLMSIMPVDIGNDHTDDVVSYLFVYIVNITCCECR